MFILRSMEKPSVDAFCQKCNLLVEAKVIARGAGEPRNAEDLDLDIDAEYYGDRYAVALCPRCSSPFLVREELHGVAGEFEVITSETILFPTLSETKLDGLPEAVARSLEQAHRCLGTASYDACALMCRRAVEAVCKELGVSGASLARKIEDLQGKGRIDRRMLDWAHGVRALGNAAAHDVEATTELDDARDILEFTEALLTHVFVLDAKFRAFQSRHVRKQR